MAASQAGHSVPEFGVGRVTRFYLPLMIQAFSQSLTYPLVAGIISHGIYGVNELTAFCQGQMLMFMISALGGGLVMTGLVFAKTRKGYQEFRRLNTIMMIALLMLQCVPALPPFADWIFRGFFALPPESVTIGRWMLVGGVIMNGSFFLRNLPMVVLFNNLESGKANIATFVRMLVTFGCATLFPRFHLVGAYWGLVALTSGCVVEFILTWCFARKYVRALPGTTDDEHVSIREQLAFTIPLSLGSMLLMCSPLLVAAFVGRSVDAADMLAINYVTLGVANPVAYAALRMQAVAIEFPQKDAHDRRLLGFAIGAGFLLGLLPLVFSTDLMGDWYFGTYQNVPERLLATTKFAIACYAPICIIHAIRGRIEGIAAIRRKPRAVMSGQISYVIMLLVVLAITLPLGVPGWAMAMSAIYAAPIAAGTAVYLYLAWHPEKETLRAKLKARRRAFAHAANGALRARAAEQMTTRLLAEPHIAVAIARQRPIAVYLATPDEFDLDPFIRAALAQGANLVAPAATEKGDYCLRQLTGLSSRDVRPGPHAIREPAAAPIIPTNAVAVWLVPGLGFTKCGHRLGYGGGNYDRLLARASNDAFSIGIGFACQCLHHLPQSHYDQSLSSIICL